MVLEWDALDCHWTSKKQQKKGKAKGKASAAAAAEEDGSSGSSSGTKQILHNLTGHARPGR